MEIRLVNDLDHWRPGRELRPVYDSADMEPPQTGPAADVGLLIRKYWLLLLVLMILGVAGGFTSVVFSSPMYKASLSLEVNSVSESWLKNSLDGMSLEANEVNIQTQINILRGGTFRNRGAARVRSELVPLAPIGRGIFARLRERFRPATRDPIENARRGLDLALETFDARPVNRTRLIELSCESTSPDVAAQFLNAMANEFVEDTSQAHTQSSQKTTDWLAGQIEDTKTKLQDAQQRLRNFVQASGNLFVGPEGPTLADTELSQAKNKLADVRSQRITAETRYEISLKVPPESLVEVQNDSVLKTLQVQVNTLKQQKASLLVTFTPKNAKVQQIDAQIDQLEQAYQQEVSAVLKKIRDDYDAAKREEQHRAEYYDAKSQRVGAEAGKASQYGELKKEVETQQQMLQTLLAQSSQVGLSNSVPISPMRIVERSTPPSTPYKPRPMLNISFGAIFGMALAGGLAFLRERMDSSIRAPGSSRRFLNTPELGVIPNLQSDAVAVPQLASGTPAALGGNPDHTVTALTNWRNAPAFVTESFRGTLASILRTQPNGTMPRVLLVTSPGPGEGKTTVVQNLGLALAETGRKILLLDADFRRPHLHKRFHVPNDRSLIDLLSEETPLANLDPRWLGLSTGIPGLFVMPNRPTDSHIAKVLYSPRLREIFQKLRDSYDMILVDAPPFLHLADARIVGPLTDAAVLVLRSGVTSREHATEAYRRMREDGLLLLGTILTAWDASNAYLKRHYYYYDYADGTRE
jgi:succinoglycan biosynthesis transport protein ExoP